MQYNAIQRGRETRTVSDESCDHHVCMKLGVDMGQDSLKAFMHDPLVKGPTMGMLNPPTPADVGAPLRDPDLRPPPLKKVPKKKAAPTPEQLLLKDATKFLGNLSSNIVGMSSLLAQVRDGTLPAEVAGPLESAATTHGEALKAAHLKLTGLLSEHNVTKEALDGFIAVRDGFLKFQGACVKMVSAHKEKPQKPKVPKAAKQSGPAGSA